MDTKKRYSALITVSSQTSDIRDIGILRSRQAGPRLDDRLSAARTSGIFFSAYSERILRGGAMRRPRLRLIELHLGTERQTYEVVERHRQVVGPQFFPSERSAGTFSVQHVLSSATTSSARPLSH